MKRSIRRSLKRFISLVALLSIFLAIPLLGQVPDALMPVARQQFFSASGVPLANGCIFTYAAGSSTPLATYLDSTGVFPNTNPVILDAGGFASIWLANQSYRIVVFSSGGVNCAFGSQQWAADNVSAYTILNQAQNLFLGTVTSDPAGVAGEIGYRSDIPCFRGFTTLWDCFTMNNLAATLTNKTIDIGANTLTGIPNTGGQYIRNNGTRFVPSPIQVGDFPAGSVIANGVFGCVNFINTNYTVAPTDELCLDEFTAAGLLINLPSVSTVGFTAGTVYHFKAAAGIAGPTVISSTSSIDTIGNNIYTLQPGQTVVFWSAGGSWISEPGSSLPGIAYNTPSASVNGNIPTTTMATAPSTGATYRFSWYGDVTAIGASCAAGSTVIVDLTYTDAAASSPSIIASSGFQFGTNTATISFAIGSTNNGIVGDRIPQPAGGLLLTTFRAKASTAIQYSTVFTPGASCSPAPSYQLYPILEQLTAN